MSLQEVEQAGKVADETGRAADEAREALKIACMQAAQVGIPHAAIARAAGVHRHTIRAWVAGPENTLTQVEQYIVSKQRES